jgi:hypothetical protein
MSEVIEIERHTFAAMLKSADGNLKKMSAPRALSNRRSVDEWFDTIAADASHSVGGIIAEGRHLREAKDQLDHHGEWLPLLERLKIGERYAQMLMKIAANEVLANPNHWFVLPRSWRTLYELSTLPLDVLKARIDDGTISPELTRKNVAAAKGKPARSRNVHRRDRAKAAFEERIAELEAALEDARATARDRERELYSEIETLRAKVAELEDREASQPQSAPASANQIVDLTEDDMRRRREEMALLESLGQMTFGWRRRRAGVPYRTHKAAAAEVAS